MAFTNTKENGLESLIVKWLVEQNGYEQGTNADYNREYAIDETRLFRFLNDTQPDAMVKLGVFKSDMKKKQFLNRLQGEIAKRGIIDVLRNGIKVYPANLIMFYLTPTENNAKAKEMFEKNIFSVTRQLQFSNDATRLALDMCTLMKYSGSAWAAATETQSLTYTWYAQDKDGNEITFGKTGKVIYLSAADIDSIMTLQCDVSN